MSARKTKAPSNTNKIQKNQYLQVYVRCRPLNENEVNQRSTSVVDIQSQKEIAVQDRCNSKITKTYAFDKVFSPNCSQADIYQTVVEPLISDVLGGFNCTVFAYGQTGSGKTFTMEGDLGSNSAQVFSKDSKAGLVPRAMCALFDELRVLKSEYTVRISLMELYNEELYDLLSPDEVPPKLRLFEDTLKKGSVLVHGLQEVMVHTQSQVLDELRKGSAKRQVAATLMNAQSSRSHTIFCVTVHFKENSVDGEELLRTGKLNLVDLAGSENIGRSGSVDKRAREAASINQSLLTLSRVTSCLVEHQPHVPYRESKLTRLLQDSLGGRTKTSLIATISPSHSNVEETLSTLDYAHRAKSVANKPEVNQKVSQNVIMKEYTDLIEDLKKKLDLHRNGAGIYINDDNYKQIVEQTRERNQEICDIIAKSRAVLHLKKSADETFAHLSASLESNKRNLENVNHTIIKTSEEIVESSEVLKKATVELDEAQNLLKNVSLQETELRSQAEQLTNVVESVHKDSEKIHDRLDFSRVVLVENSVVLRKLREKAHFYMDASKKKILYLMTGRNILFRLLSAIENLDSHSRSSSALLVESIQKYLMTCKSQIQSYSSIIASVAQQRSTFATRAAAGQEALLSLLVNAFRNVEEALCGACEQYHSLISKLPLKSTSLVDFVKQSVENIKDASKSQMDMMRSRLNNIHKDSDKRILNIVNMLNDFQQAEKGPLKIMKKNIEMLSEKTSNIKALCVESREAIDAHQAELLRSQEEKMKKIMFIKEHLGASVQYLEDQQSVISDHCKSVKDVLSVSQHPLIEGIKERSQIMVDIVTESASVVNKAEDIVSNLLSYDLQGPLKQLLEDSKNVSSQNEATLTSEVSSFASLAQDSDQFNQDLSTKFAHLKQNINQYEQEEDEALGMFLEGVKSTGSEVLEHFESGRALVDEIVSSEISHDVSTGQTPVRKSYGPIPRLISLPSPVRNKVRERIQRAPWRRLLRSPRKTFKSAMSPPDVDDECMASDSEITVSKKKVPEFNGLQKASSLSDLRSHAVFHRPRIPKKYARKVL